MKSIPIVPHYTPQPPAKLLAKVDCYAQRLRREQPQLADRRGLECVEATVIDDSPTLHLDDQSGARVLQKYVDLSFRQELARLRAGDGDLVAVCGPVFPEYEDYAREQLGLGRAAWLQARPREDRRQLAAALWLDEAARGRLLAVLNEHGTLQIDPFRGTWGVWQLAALLADQGRGGVRVIAPPPALADWVNNKLRFSTAVRDLFGTEYIPTFTSAGNLAIAANHIRHLAPGEAKLIIKLPDSMGGGGNLPLAAAEFRGRPLREVHAKLRQAFAGSGWNGECELLVGEWESQVLSTPSAQLWIPPGDQSPIIEGLFEQILVNGQGMFVGTRRAELLPERAREMVDHCWLLGRLFQRLGYVGRCSFDMLLVADGHGRQRLKFLECNGRWGGASMPMTLMNRVFGDWTSRPFTYRTYEKLGLEEIGLSRVLAALGNEVFDVRTGRGRVILANPGRMPARGGISAIVLGDTWDQAAAAAKHELPEKLAAISRQPSPLPVGAASALPNLSESGQII